MKNPTDTPRTDAMYETHTSEYQRRLLSEDLELKLAAETANREKCCRDGNAIADELFDTQLKLKASQEAYLQSIERDDYLTQALAEAKQWLDERYKALSEADERAERAEAEVERLGKLLFETRSLLTEFYDCVDIGGLHDGDCNISTEDPEKWEQGCNCTTADLRRKYIKLYSK